MVTPLDVAPRIKNLNQRIQPEVQNADTSAIPPAELGLPVGYLQENYSDSNPIDVRSAASIGAATRRLSALTNGGSGDGLEDAVRDLGLPEGSIFNPNEKTSSDPGLRRTIGDNFPDLPGIFVVQESTSMQPPTPESGGEQPSIAAESDAAGPEQPANQEASEPIARTLNHADGHHIGVPHPPRTRYISSETSRDRRAERTQRLRDRAYDSAIEQNERHDKTMSETIRDNAEGKILVEKNTYLRAAFELGQELLALHNSKAAAKNPEAHTKQLEEKKASFEALINKYEDDGADSRAISYIVETTYNRVADPDGAPIEGTAFRDGKKVDIVNFVETPDGTKAYKVKNEDGSIEIVYDSAVEFKRDYAAPEVEELSKSEKMKNWFGAQRKKLQEFGGSAYIGEKWNAFGNWLTSRHITEGMSEQEIEAQKQKNRRHNAMGAGALVLAGAMVAGVSIFAGINAHEQLAQAGTAGGGTGTEGWGHGPLLPGASPSTEVHTNDPSQLFPLKAEGVKELPLDTGGNGGPQIIESVPPGADLGINNSAYDVPHNGTLEGVFKGVGIDKSKLYDNLQSLADRFPGDLKRVGSDVQIRQSGLLSTELRQAIEELRNS